MHLRSILLFVTLSTLGNLQAATKTFTFTNTHNKPTHITVHLNANITDMRNVDVLVNAANETLIGSAGIARALQDAAGPELVQHLTALPRNADGNRCNIAQVIVTPAFQLQKSLGNNYIFHTVGPRDTTQDREILLAKTYQALFNTIAKLNTIISSVAVGTISTGIFGYPKEEAASIAVATTVQAIRSGTCPSVRDIHLIVWDKDYFDVYVQLLKKMTK